ncbi:MAG: 4Fe-4S binding protein [Alistipes finegoldii]
MTTRKRKIVLYTFDCTGCGYCVKVCGNEVLKTGGQRSLPLCQRGRCVALQRMRTVRTTMPQRSNFTKTSR